MKFGLKVGLLQSLVMLFRVYLCCAWVSHTFSSVPSGALKCIGDIKELVWRLLLVL